MHQRPSDDATLSSKECHSTARELSFSELSLVLGGQSNAATQEELIEQAKKTFEAWSDFLAPILKPVVETGVLLETAASHLRYRIEDTDSRPMSDEEAMRREADMREAEEREQKEAEEERERLIEGDEEPTEEEVKQWLEDNRRDAGAGAPSNVSPYSGEPPVGPGGMNVPHDPNGRGTPEVTIQDGASSTDGVGHYTG